MMGLIFIFLPLQLAMAGGKVEFPPWAHCAFWDVFCILGSIAEYTFSIPIRIGFFVLLIPIALTALFAGLLYSIIVAICNWMIYICLRVGITPANPITPQVVTIGWTFTRDFANMFFILILVFIGLATILKLREYEAKKLLPKLIIIALLINFTPVIVGFIVDMGNIVTNFFLSRAANIMNFPTILKMVWDYFSGSLTTIFLWDGRFFEQFVEALGIFIGILIYGVVVIIFFLLGSWIYFWVMLTFFLRIVELWILMILCPIAFFSQVLPPSKTVKMLFPSILHWDKWWEEFLQWIIWGIPMGFFLYLSNWVMANTDVIQSKFAVTTPLPAATTTLQTMLETASTTVASSTGGMLGLETQFISLVTSILAPTVGLVLLYKGYKIAKETAPAAAKAIIEGVKKVGQIAVAAGITAVTMGAGAGATAGLLGKAAAGAQRLEAFAGGEGLKIGERKIKLFGKERKIPGIDIKPITGKWRRRLVKPSYLLTKPLSWATRGMEMAAAPPLLEYAAKTRRVDWGARFKGMEAPEIAQQISLIPIKQHRVSAAGWMQEQGLLDKPGLPEGFKDKMIEEARSLTKDIHYQKSATDVLQTLTRGVDEKVMLNLEVDPAEKEKLKDKIGKIAGEISQDVKMKPEIDAEANKITTTREIREEARSRNLSVEDIKREKAARDMAAREIWVGELKAGDVKNIEKKSLREDIGTRRGMKSWSSAHMSALVNNFKKEVVDAALKETGGLNAMFEGKTAEEGRDILEKLYEENPRIVRSFATTPAGREWNWGGRKFLPKNSKGRPDFGAFEAEMEKKKPEEKEEKKEGPKEGYVEGKGPTG